MVVPRFFEALFLKKYSTNHAKILHNDSLSKIYILSDFGIYSLGSYSVVIEWLIYFAILIYSWLTNYWEFCNLKSSQYVKFDFLEFWCWMNFRKNWQKQVRKKSIFRYFAYLAKDGHITLLIKNQQSNHAQIFHDNFGRNEYIL